jgi:hypothetical protein
LFSLALPSPKETEINRKLDIIQGVSWLYSNFQATGMLFNERAFFPFLTTVPLL